MRIPIIDIFAGPGGLGEGFSSLLNADGERIFKIVLSVEMEKYAHQTLTLRSFYRQFKSNEIPEDYYEVLRGNLSVDELFKRYKKESEAAKAEAWKSKLGYDKESEKPDEVDRRIENALHGVKDWVLIGGPPCQAYSVVGRSRKQNNILNPKDDERVDLYKQYLRILAIHNPAVFIMENVKGLLSAQIKESPIFSLILRDLSEPVRAFVSGNGKKIKNLDCPGYRIFSLVVEPRHFDGNGNPIFNHSDYIIKCENYGVPQSRHRVILLGIRKDIEVNPGTLYKNEPIPISKVLIGVPRLRSGISQMKDSDKNWIKILTDLSQKSFLKISDKQVYNRIKKVTKKLKLPRNKSGNEFVPYSRITIKYNCTWYLDDRIGGICNHVSRSHIKDDIYRYMFVSCFGKEYNKSPILYEFPKQLLPKHANVDEAINTNKFADRFRVQLWDEPAKTITSHISKDGHYYIHPDPTQCRSLTVREAARIQTFPDNYYFCGPRTSQYIQVGNAVPPFLAKQIAEIVYKIIATIQSNKKLNMSHNHLSI